MKIYFKKIITNDNSWYSAYNPEMVRGCRVGEKYLLNLEKVDGTKISCKDNVHCFLVQMIPPTKICFHRAKLLLQHVRKTLWNGS
jgi:hypothetical protein